MDSIKKQSERLNELIKQSTEYQQYQIALARLKNDPELYQKINEFRRKNYEYQKFEESQENKYDSVNALSSEYEDLLNNAIVYEFFLAEQRVLRMMQHIYVDILDSLEFDYEYMER